MTAINPIMLNTFCQSSHRFLFSIEQQKSEHEGEERLLEVLEYHLFHHECHHNKQRASVIARRLLFPTKQSPSWCGRLLWSLLPFAMTRLCYTKNSSYKSFHSGFLLLIKSIFLCLEPPLICFSRAMASSMVAYSS